jgi:energy-coupling factor transport system substrate-specific component
VSWQLAIFCLLAAVLLGGFAWYERSRPPSQTVALVAAMAALAIAGRVALAPIPNVVATTDVVIFTGYAIGGAPGFATGALAGLISNFWLGQGPWTPWQMAGWGLCGVFGALLARASARRGGLDRLPLAAACGFAGIAYGALLNFSLMVSYGGELSLARFGALMVRAIPFDLAHAIGNVTLALVAGPALLRMLLRFRERFEVRWSGAAPSRTSVATAATVAVALFAIVISISAPGGKAEASGGPAAAKSWLRNQQRADGGFGASQTGFTSVGMTEWSALGLEAAGQNPFDVVSEGHSVMDYLRANASSIRSTGDLERTVLVVTGAGLGTRHFAGRDMVAELMRHRRHDGSFDGMVNLTAFGVMAMRASGEPGSAPSIAWLRKQQNDNGGWGFAPGANSDADSTGAVLEALRHGGAVARGVAFLRGVQAAGGGFGFPGGGVNAQSTAWAIQGLLAAGTDPARVRKGGKSPFDYLASVQAGDGHYRYSPSSDQSPVWVTAYALAAVERKAFPLAAVARRSEQAGCCPVGSYPSKIPPVRLSAAGRRKRKHDKAERKRKYLEATHAQVVPATPVAPQAPPVTGASPAAHRNGSGKTPILGGLAALGLLLGAYALWRRRAAPSRR